jgi:hypothetical protein
MNDEQPEANDDVVVDVDEAPVQLGAVEEVIKQEDLEESN